MFMSTGIQPWQAMDVYAPSWDASLDHTHNSVQFDSGLSSIVSSPAASNSNNGSENATMIRELIGKLGRIGNPNTSLPEISPNASSLPVLPSPGFSSASTSLYSTPLSSPPKVSLPVMGLDSSVADFSADPGFAERAARFSCFGSRSFNGRSSQIRSSLANLGGAPYGMARVLSSPSLKALGTKNNLQQPGDRPDIGSQSLEESSISDQRENGPKGMADMNSRKRKAAQKGKAKESANAAKVSWIFEFVRSIGF